MSHLHQHPIMETQPIPLSIDLAQSLALSMHNLIKKASRDDVVLEINNNITSYLSKELSDLDIKLTNKKETFLYLSKKFEVITAVLETAQNARSLFPNDLLTLSYDDGIDEEGEENTYPSLVLYVKTDSMTKEIREKIRALSDPYEEVFARYNAFFHTEPHLVNYV